MEIVVFVILGLAAAGFVSFAACAVFVGRHALKTLRVAASTPPQPQSRDRRSRRPEPRQEPQHETRQESAAAGALRRRQHEKGEE